MSKIFIPLIFLSLLFSSCKTPERLPNTKITISIQKQELLVISKDRVIKFPISTSKYGTGFSNNKTPTGNFRIYSKIGQGARAGTNFHARQPTKRKTGIISRIMQLDGLDEANSNTLYRYIYIHGTPSKVGYPNSIGCITLSSSDVIKLFDIVEVGDRIKIKE